MGFRETAFSVWGFKFAYTVDQLLKDGVEPEKVCQYFASNMHDVGFVWRVSYVEHLKAVNAERQVHRSIKELLNSVWNTLLFPTIYILLWVTRQSTIATRRTDLGGVVVGSSDPIVLPIRADRCSMFRGASISTRGTHWKRVFMEKLVPSLEDLSNESITFFEHQLDIIFPKIFHVRVLSEVNFFQNIELLNFAGDIFKSGLFFELLWRFYGGRLHGAQHGGGYGLLQSRLLETEIASYDKFFFQNLSKSRSYLPSADVVRLVDKPGVILSGSMPYERMEAFRKKSNLSINNKISYERLKLRSILKEMDIPLYIREHPKANSKSYTNTEIDVPDIGKPIIWSRGCDLIILEAPGTTTELNCIKNGLNHVCVFNLEDYSLTDKGKKHYESLKHRGQLIMVDDLKEYIEDVMDA